MKGYYTIRVPIERVLVETARTPVATLQAMATFVEGVSHSGMTPKGRAPAFQALAKEIEALADKYKEILP